MQGSGTRWGRRPIGAAALALILIVAWGMAVPARADLYSASKAYRKGHYAAAFKEFRTLAELGQPAAQYDLAVSRARVSNKATSTPMPGRRWRPRAGTPAV